MCHLRVHHRSPGNSSPVPLRVGALERSLPLAVEYALGDNGDALHSLTQTHDADGRVVRLERGRYLTGEPAQVLDMSYGAEPSGMAFHAVTVDGLMYNYEYGAEGKRHAKVYPTGVRDEYFHASDGSLRVDVGSDSVLATHFRPVDDYVWLGGRPVVVLRGRLDATQPVRLPDNTADCGRNGEESSCGVYFPVTDVLGKPVLMLDAAGRVVGTGETEPFGHVNRVSRSVPAPHPYPTGYEQVLDTHAQPQVAGTRLRMRVLLRTVDVAATDAVRLVDADTGAELWRVSGEKLGRVVSPWVEPSAGRVHVVLTSAPVTKNAAPPAYTGAVLEGYEYQRFQGPHPFWTPLRFPGQYHDAETDLFENWNRYYEPASGRYLQPEPLLHVKPSALPAYAYAGNNPVHRIDPDGNFFYGSNSAGYASLTKIIAQSCDPFIPIMIEYMERSNTLFEFVAVDATKRREVAARGGARSAAHQPGVYTAIYYDLRFAATSVEWMFGLDMSLDQLLAHELGRAYAFALRHEGIPTDHDAMAVYFENSQRCGKQKRRIHTPTLNSCLINRVLK